MRETMRNLRGLGFRIYQCQYPWNPAQVVLTDRDIKLVAADPLVRGCLKAGLYLY